MWPISGEKGRNCKDWFGQRTSGGWKKEGWPAWRSWWVSCPVSTHLILHDPGIIWVGSLAWPPSNLTCNHRSLTAMFWHKVWWQVLLAEEQEVDQLYLGFLTQPCWILFTVGPKRESKLCESYAGCYQYMTHYPFLLQCSTMQCQTHQGGTVSLWPCVSS